MRGLFAAVLALVLAACAATPPATDLQREVADTERAFAKTMADRDHAAFTRFLAEDAIFFSGTTALRGKEEVARRWAPFFAGPQAPFSWEPDQVEVLASGTLAHSSGPVRNAKGELIARFNSVWRREGPGTWRIVFDRGSEVCRGSAGAK